jgi:predicted RNA polymerase sigma factor
VVGYQLLLTVRGDFLAKLGRFDGVRPDFERAAALPRNACDWGVAPRARMSVRRRFFTSSGWGCVPG